MDANPIQPGIEGEACACFLSYCHDTLTPISELRARALVLELLCRLMKMKSLMMLRRQGFPAVSGARVNLVPMDAAGA